MRHPLPWRGGYPGPFWVRSKMIDFSFFDPYSSCSRDPSPGTPLRLVGLGRIPPSPRWGLTRRLVPPHGDHPTDGQGPSARSSPPLNLHGSKKAGRHWELVPVGTSLCSAGIENRVCDLRFAFPPAFRLTDAPDFFVEVLMIYFKLSFEL